MSGSMRIGVFVASLAMATSGGSAVAMAAAACPNAGFAVVAPRASQTTRPVRDARHHTLFIQRDQLTTTTDIAEIKLENSADGAQLLLRFKPEAAEELHQATTNRADLQLAFVVDDEALGSVTWDGPFGIDAGDGVQVKLRPPVPDAGQLVAAINQCVAAGGK